MQSTIADFSNETIVNLSDKYISQLNERAMTRHEKLWLLVDPTLRSLHDDSDLWPLLDEFERHEITFPHSDLHGVMALWLVDIAPENNSLLQQSILEALSELRPEKLALGRGRTVCGWLISSAPVDYLVRHISETAIQRVVDQGLYMLRFFDPAVIALVSDHLDNWQRARLFGAVEEWYFLDGEGQLNSQKGYYAGEEQIDFSLSVTASVWEKIKRAGTLNMCLSFYREHARQKHRVSEKSARQWLEVAMDYQSATSVWSLPEIFLPLSFAILTRHRYVYLHQDIVESVAIAEKTRDKNYQPVVRFLEHADWDQIIADCEQQYHHLIA